MFPLLNLTMFSILDSGKNEENLQSNIEHIGRRNLYFY